MSPIAFVNACNFVVLNCGVAAKNLSGCLATHPKRLLATCHHKIELCLGLPVRIFFLQMDYDFTLYETTYQPKTFTRQGSTQGKFS
jgi:hypothetical protein